ncbi:MAG: dipeptidase [bacterium]|nr:dipeptidase [bacterium]
MTDTIHSAAQYAVENAARFRQNLIDLLKIPSISTLPEHTVDVERAAQWIIAEMKRIGLGRGEIFRAAGKLPLVYGEWLGAGADAPTVLVYCHYDVQPALMEDGWTHDPFDPIERDGRLYARGAVDSKSHVIAQLAAAEAMIAAGDCPVNLKFLFEGEEESGSEHIFAFVEANPDLLRSDAIVVSDGSMPDEEQPLLVYGLRGVVTFELTVIGPTRDLHSGMYGGMIHNPIHALADILAGLHHPDGTVNVPGFYDAVRPLTDEERGILADYAPWMVSDWQETTGAPALYGEPGFEPHERAGARPTLEINGVAGGHYGTGFKTVLPSKAWAKISCRLVPDQDPDVIEAVLRVQIERLTPPTVRSELVRLEDGSPGVLIDWRTPAMQAGITAYERGWGKRPVMARGGGSIPVVSAFQRHLDAPQVLMPFGLRAGGAHGPDEYVVWAMFHKGIDTMIHFYRALAGT